MDNTKRVLVALGESLRRERIRRNQTMEELSTRARISRPTLAKMEKGAGTVSVGAWARVLDALDRVGDLATVLQPPESDLFERLDRDKTATRKRVRKQ